MSRTSRNLASVNSSMRREIGAQHMQPTSNGTRSSTNGGMERRSGSPLNSDLGERRAKCCPHGAGCPTVDLIVRVVLSYGQGYRYGSVQCRGGLSPLTNAYAHRQMTCNNMLLDTRQFPPSATVHMNGLGSSSGLVEGPRNPEGLLWLAVCAALCCWLASLTRPSRAGSSLFGFLETVSAGWWLPLLAWA